ncbi:hypothetical protein EVAR_96396_1 [Eumeta japonica]|uniref:Uncharacterized protein n=1 Tax=Eumeta variegata TaxID=151549 RepID=A0A4C1WAE3_EUMVA|nr:hypothetical protein EVAR_96396_1 [Eumeta japonica]
MAHNGFFSSFPTPFARGEVQKKNKNIRGVVRQSPGVERRARNAELESGRCNEISSLYDDIGSVVGQSRGPPPRCAPRPSRPCRSRVRCSTGRHASQRLTYFIISDSSNSLKFWKIRIKLSQTKRSFYINPLGSNHEKPNGVNNVMCSMTRALAFPSGNSKPGRTWDHRPWRCYSPIPGIALPSSLTPSSVPRLLGL